MPVTEDEFAAYQSLSEETEDHRWAFGTGFTDPLEGIGASVPDGVDAAALAAYCLMLGDDALVYSHRLQQWMTRMPELEEETALANIALDLLGQARMLLTRAGQAEGRGRDEDRLAFFRDEREFRNVRLVERAGADFAELAGRLFVFSAWRLTAFQALTTTRDPVLAAIAAKAVKELTYHRDYAAGWVIRLGDGTDLSHAKMQAALDTIWPLVAELDLSQEADAVLDTVFAAASPTRKAWPVPTRTRHGDRLRGGGRGARPRAAHGDDRGPRHSPRREAGRRHGDRYDHADVLRLPGDARDRG